jgi:dynein heavy chain 2
MKQYESQGRITPLIKEWKDLMTSVSDNQSLLASLKDSKYAARFMDQIAGIEKVLFGLDDSLHTLNVI